MWATASVIVPPQSRDVQQGRMEKFGHAFMKGYQIPLQWERSFNGTDVASPLPDASDISPGQQAFFPLPVSPLGITAKGKASFSGAGQQLIFFQQEPERKENKGYSSEFIWSLLPISTGHAEYVCLRPSCFFPLST